MKNARDIACTFGLGLIVAGLVTCCLIDAQAAGRTLQAMGLATLAFVAVVEFTFAVARRVPITRWEERRFERAQRRGARR